MVLAQQHRVAQYMLPLNTILQGDALELAKTLPDNSIHCIVTSPPYWSLRDYGTATWVGGSLDCDHSTPRSRGDDIQNGDKQGTSKGSRPNTQTQCKCGAIRIDSQMGLEETPELFIEKMVVLFRELRRVLRKDGTLWLNMGDSYAGSWGNYGAREGNQRERASDEWERPAYEIHKSKPATANPSSYGLKPKDLCGIPWRLALALQNDGWYLRSDIIWSKPNPMPESVTDRPTKAHEYLFLLTKSPKYYYDSEAIREKTGNEATMDEYLQSLGSNNGADSNRLGNGYKKHSIAITHPNGRNKRSVWEIATQPYPEAHFATFPEALIEPCILAGTSAKGVCPECGGQWERVISKEREYDHITTKAGKSKNGPYANQTGNGIGTHDIRHGVYNKTQTTGWQPTCKCYRTRNLIKYQRQNAIQKYYDSLIKVAENEKIPLLHRETFILKAAEIKPYLWSNRIIHSKAPVIFAMVLDPFLGSGTTASVAKRLNQNWLGFELNPEYIKLAQKRINNTQPPLFILT